MIVLLDNQDSFVYNLVDAFAGTGRQCVVVRNTTPVGAITALDPDMICLSPGPGHPGEAGVMMELIDTVVGDIPILGVCLGFQALLEHWGGQVRPCGPEHGRAIPMTLTDAGLASPIFAGLATDTLPDQPGRSVPVARYHSLGCTEVPEQMEALATTPTKIGDVVMAARSVDGTALGFQFHPESVLTMSGPTMLERAIEVLTAG